MPKRVRARQDPNVPEGAMMHIGHVLRSHYEDTSPPSEHLAVLMAQMPLISGTAAAHRSEDDGEATR
jgi:hypothetical protein